MPKPRAVTLIYVERDDSILLLKRARWPYVGQWVAPGGKIEAGESPRQGALRELREETALGVAAADLELRALVTETSDRPDWQWQIFIYRTRRAVGEIGSAVTPEGELRWFDRERLAALPIPQGDREFMPWVLSDRPGVREFYFRYDDDLDIVERSAC